MLQCMMAMGINEMHSWEIVVLIFFSPPSLTETEKRKEKTEMRKLNRKEWDKIYLNLFFEDDSLCWEFEWIKFRENIQNPFNKMKCYSIHASNSIVFLHSFFCLSLFRSLSVHLPLSFQSYSFIWRKQKNTKSNNNKM